MPPTVATAFRDYLIAQGIVRAPETPGSAPPAWRDPQEGTPNPADKGVNVTVGIFRTTGIAPRRFEGAWRTPIVQVNIRALKAPLAEQVGEQIEQAVLDRRNWLMGGLRVIESQQFAPLSLVTADEQSYDYRTSFALELYRDPAVLAAP